MEMEKEKVQVVGSGVGPSTVGGLLFWLPRHCRDGRRSLSIESTVGRSYHATFPHSLTSIIGRRIISAQGGAQGRILRSCMTGKCHHAQTLQSHGRASNTAPIANSCGRTSTACTEKGDHAYTVDYLGLRSGQVYPTGDSRRGAKRPPVTA